MSEDRKNTSNFQILLSVVLILMTIFTIRSIHELKTNQKKLDDINNEVSKVLKENTDLQEKIIYADSEEFIEKHAVDDLKLTKDGYEIVIVNGKSNNDSVKGSNMLKRLSILNKQSDESDESVIERVLKFIGM